MKKNYYKHSRNHNWAKRSLLLLTSTIIFCSSIIIPISTAGAKVLPGNLMTIFNKGIRRLDDGNTDGSGPVDGCLTDGSNVTWIGDSISEQSAGTIKAKLPNVDLHAMSSKQFSTDITSTNNKSGITILGDLGDNLRNYVVFALGTNGTSSVTSSSIGNALSLIGDSRTLVLVTNYDLSKTRDYTNNNNAMKQAANDHENVVVADWAEIAENNLSSDGTNSYISDDVHLTSNGIIAFVNIIISTLSLGGSGSSGNLGSPAPTSLTGEDNAQKIWNYFKARGLTDIAAAGALGNLKKESSAFDPYVGESGDTSWSQTVLQVGFGIIQWTNTDNNTMGRRYQVIQHLKNNGITTPDRSREDEALLLELNWLWDGEYGGMTWQEQVNAETTVDGDPSVHFTEDNTGNGSTMVFHKFVERSGDGVSGKQQRINYAKEFLERFGGTSGC